MRWLVITALVCSAGRIAAEEITLKDGQKIVGTIVGYENDMFRVETEYGIALVRKDKVSSIQVTKSDATVGKAESTKRPATKSIPEKPARVAASPEVAPASPPPVTPAKPVTPPPPPVSHPLDVPLPAHLAEHEEGTTYINDTFQFSMFKPPDWKIFEGVTKETGSGIMAIGTTDEQTLLFVDRQVWSGTPSLTGDVAETKLRQTYQDYKKTSEESIQCDGQPAIRRTFTGVLDGAEWHGVAVHVAHGNTVFGIIGLTSAETFQFQQALFSKIIKTFHFLAPPTPPVGSGSANPAS
jgi:hypothetical protein